MSTIIGNQNASLSITSSKIALQLNETDVISLVSGSNTIDMGGYEINNVQVGSGSGLITQDACDARYYLNTTTLDQFSIPVNSLNIGAQKITNVADPTDPQDAVTKSYAEANFLSAASTINDMSAPVADFSMNGNKLTAVSDPTNAQDAATKNYTDTTFYSQTTPLDAITQPAANVSLNSFRLTNLADPVDNQDAATKAYTGATFYPNTTTLDQITAPAQSLDMNAKKISNVAPGTAAGDALTVGQSSLLATATMYTNSNLTSVSYPYVVPFSQVYKPTAPSGAQEQVSLSENGSLQVQVAGTYKLEATLLLQYSERTDSPVIAKIQRYDSADQQVAGQSINNVAIPTNRPPALNTNTYTYIQQLIQLSALDKIKLVLTNSNSSLSMVSNGSSVAISLVQ